MAVNYDPQADAPLWREFLAVAQPDAGQRGFIQRWCGYKLSGLTAEQVIVLFQGKGSNGKSVLIETLEAIFGDYALRLPFESLLRDDGRRGSDATPDIARLPGRRFVVASESEGGVTFSTKMIKDLTERTAMDVRNLYGGFFQFRPQHKVTLMFNEAPAVRSSDDGTWRRIRLVPWPMQFYEEHDRDYNPANPMHRFKDLILPDKLKAEYSGILNWLLDGWRLYREHGLKTPDEIVEATAAYRSDNDPVGRFIRTVLVEDQASWLTGKVLFDVYKRWCEESGLTPWTSTSFGRAVSARLKKSKDGVVKYLNIKINHEWEARYGSSG